MNNKILIIEDNIEMQDLLKLLLTQEGFFTVSVASGNEALAVLKTNPNLMLILLDLSLPDMQTHTLLEAIKEHQPAKDVPIIYFSAAPNLRHMILPEGVVGVIQKPFQIQNFLRTIDAFKQENEMMQTLFRNKNLLETAKVCH